MKTLYIVYLAEPTSRFQTEKHSNVDSIIMHDGWLFINYHNGSERREIDLKVIHSFTLI